MPIDGTYRPVGGAKADDAGWTLRVSRIDGEDLPSTNDYNPQRVNVSVTDGEVDAILSIG